MADPNFERFMQSALLEVERRILGVLIHHFKCHCAQASLSSFSIEALVDRTNRSEIVEHVDGSFEPVRSRCGASFDFGDGINLVSHLHKLSPSRHCLQIYDIA
jgi:hypothetical protein